MSRDITPIAPAAPITQALPHAEPLPDVRFAISERLTAFERTQMEANGLDPDDYFVLVGMPFEQNMQTAVAEGRLMVQGAFATPMPVVNTRYTLLDAAGRASEANMLAAISTRMIVQKKASSIPAANPASVFMTCVKAHEGYNGVLQSLRSSVPARSEMWADDTLAFFTLTYQEASMISYRIQQLGLAGVVFVDHTPSVVAAPEPTSSDASSVPGTSSGAGQTRYLPMWADADRAALWSTVLQTAPAIDVPRVRAMAEARGVVLPRLATEEPAAPIGMLADLDGDPDRQSVFGDLLARLSERMQ